MANKAILRKERANKWLSVLLVYALFFQEFVPFARSMSSIEFNQVNNSLPFMIVLTTSADTFGSEEMSDITAIQKVESQQMSMAVTSGPGQGETSGFSLGTTDGLVDKFTGDFTYSIPLMSVEGYPIVLNYNSNVGMNTDASWVGLGWDLNVGSVSREMRGLPDEFNGEQKIVKTVHQLDATTDGWKLGPYVAWSKKNAWIGNVVLKYPSVQLTALFGSYENSYLGLGRTFDFGLQSGISIGESVRFSPHFGLGFSVDTKNGIGKNSSIGLSISNQDKTWGSGLTYAKNYNSRAGITNKSIGLGANGTYESSKTSIYGNYGTSVSLTYGSVTGIPKINYNGTGTNYRVGLDGYVGVSSLLGIWKFGIISEIYNSSNSLDLDPSAPVIYQPAYGYLHSGKRHYENSNVQALMDFNRTGDFEYSEEMKNLAFSFQTYDIFRASAMGMNGTFRARRNDVGTYYDPTATNKNKGASVDFSAGITTPIPVEVELGASLGVSMGDAESGNWENFGAYGDNVLSFDEEFAGNNFDKSVYFKPLGESTPEDTTQFNLLGGSTIAYLDVNESGSGNEIAQSNYLKVGGVGGSYLTGSSINSSNTSSPIISTVFNPKTAIQASQEYLSTFYYSQEEEEYVTPSVDAINRLALHRDANHLSKVEIVSSNGMIYTYGIPAYDIETNQVTFAVGNTDSLPARTVDVNTNLVRYETGMSVPDDNSIYNNRGRGHYYDKTTVPAYAHSFLLTEMRSSDYVDVEGNGLSMNDVGSYYKINQTQYYGETNDGTHNRVAGNYKWRFPISDDSGNQAFHNEGFEGTDLDDMANYSYGEKEIWYTHSIESKNFVAEFYLEDRKDAYGVQDENGQLNVNAPLKKISKIVLYNRAERIKSGADAIPLQTVEFTYDYSLCKKSPANKHTYSANYNYNSSGKLTLKEIRIYSGKSKEGGLAKYKFDYSTENPEFNYAAVDGWGNYKVNYTTRPNTIYPYAEQNELIANPNIKAWKLTAINNPMGGRIEIDYEADQYVSVQDKRTMEHLDVHAMTNLIEFLSLNQQPHWDGSDKSYSTFRKDFSYTNLQSFVTSNFTGSNFLEFYQSVFSTGGLAFYASKFGRFDKDFVPNNVMIFKLEEPLTTTAYPTKEEAAEYIKEAYFRNSNLPNDYMKEILFKMHVNVKTENSSVIKEYIPVFAKISDDFSDPFSGSLGASAQDFTSIGVMPVSDVSGDYEYGYVVVDPVNSGAREHKNNTGDDKNGILLHPIQRSALDFVRQNLPDKVYGSCVGCDPDLSIDAATFFGGDLYKKMIKAGYVSGFDDDYSTMRLYVHDSIKLGGNARVSKITYKDNWNSISSEYDSQYNWFYYYSTRTEESGVASYEPGAIIDESPFYYWDTYVNATQRFPDETKFTPTPVAGALFPIPSVGYADVRVEFGNGENYGYSKAEFYTAADYPTIETVAKIDKSHIKKRNILTGNSVDLFGFAQGVVVETNNFHGKPKQFLVMDNLDKIQSRSTYFYNDLAEKVPMIDREGVLSMEQIAMEYDIHVDSRYSANSSLSTRLGLSLKWKVPTFIPFFIFPTTSVQRREQGFFSSAVVKHVNRSAIVNRIETEYLNSINTAENMLYDKYTGNVILSSLTDEYNDTLYSMTHPSHWYHRELRDIQSTKGILLNGTISGSVLSISSSNHELLTVGDIIGFTDGTTTDQARILSISGTTFGLITELGIQYSGSVSGPLNITIIKSGRKNRLGETMQTVTTKRPILVPQTGAFTFPETEILSSSAISYRNKNNVRCNFEGEHARHNEVPIDEPFNPFSKGALGDLVLDGQFAWQSERINATHDHGTRFDGYYSDFIPFYKLGTNNRWYKIDETNHPNNNSSSDLQKWRKLGEVTRYDEYGKAVESQDQIKVHSSVLYGFNRELALLPVAQAVNARQQEIAYDGFEDYGYYDPSDLGNEMTHFDFFRSLQAGVVKINDTIRHSGLSSIELNPGAGATVTRKVSTSCLGPIEPIIEDEMIADTCLCVIPFEPTVGEYIISAWVKVGDNRAITQYTGIELDVIITGQFVSTVLPNGPITPSGPIIDGWQRMEGEFTVPVGATGEITITLKNNTENDQVYFDDLRIHPFLAGMTTTVYDPKSLLPLATHDGYNFTTFFNYDENLNQVRVRVETTDGIKTISETEFGGQKSFNNNNQ